MPYKDKEKEKQHRREYYLKNKDKRKCEHNRDEYRCKECKGAGICEHNRNRGICKDCKGSGICEHNINRRICKDCNGSAFCEHKKQKSVCRDCNGVGICEHNKQKARCRECNGSSFCEHKRQKSSCIECNGSGTCIHKKQRRNCVECGGSNICQHKVQRQSCKICDIFVYLVNVQRGRIQRIMKLTTLPKTKPSIEYLECSIEFFKGFIQSKMSQDMDFSNIQYDHIKPVSKFNLEDPEELMKCCHYSNFQPLLNYDNQAKGNKWSDKDEIFWNENIIYRDFVGIYHPQSD
jgi:hypothetical protein